MALAAVALSAVGGAAGGASPISVSVSGATGANGWYVSDAAIDWTVNPPYTATSGCVDETVGQTSSYTADCSAEDGVGGTASDSVTVKVDTSNPTLNGASNITREATSSAGANVSLPVSASDSIDPSPSVNCSPGSGTFPLGSTPVNCTATDDAGRQDSGGFTVTVQDTTAPTIAGHSDVTVEATGPGGASAAYTPPTASDAVDSSPTVTCNPAPGATLSVGSHSVSCTAKDNANNTSGPSTFNVNVVDTRPPTLGAMPASQTLEATSAAGRATTFATPTASDAVSTPTVTCSPASGATFPKGTTTVSCTAKDAAGNTSAPGTFTITIQDTTKPVLGAMPAAITANATSPSGAVVSYTPPTATDSAGTATVACSPGPGSTFPVGTTTVSCTATDGSGNVSNPGTFTVTVNDTTPPTLAPHANETREATVAAGAVVTYSAPTATDNVTAAPTVTCAPASGGTFPLGTTAVTCTARDAANNQSTSTFSVIVVDTTPPIVTVPAAKTLEANGASGSAANFIGEVSASDRGEPVTPGQISCAPGSGTTFPLGTTTVTCTATDAVGNKGTGAFTIKIVDSTPPLLHAPTEATFFADGPGGIATSHEAVQRFLRSPVAQDIVDEAVAVSHNAPAVFPMGETRITFRAIDDWGNTATETARVTVKPRPADQPTGQPALPAVDIFPPQNPRGVGANSTPGSITISWQPVSDAEQYEVYRSTSDRSLQGSTDTPNGTLVYRGKATRFKDNKVNGGVEYRYVIVAVDKAGNRSVGEVVVAVGKQLLLLRPAFGAKSSKPPVLVLAPINGATYYNIQLFRGTQKILSVWPATPRFQLPRTWRYEGKPYRLSPGVYRWYAWPGLGKREDARYGAVMGESTFTIVPAKKATAKKAKGKGKAKKKATAKKTGASKSKTSKKRKR